MIEGKKILMLFPRFFYPPNDGGKIVFFQSIKELSKNNTLDAVVNVCQGDTSYISNVQAFFRDFCICHYDVHRQYFGKFLYSFFTASPYFFHKYFHKGYTVYVDELLSKNSYDIVWIESAYLAMYAQYIKSKFPNIYIIVRSHNVESQVLENTAQNTKNFLYRKIIFREAKMMRQVERDTLKYIDQILCISSMDRDFLSKEVSFDMCKKVTLLSPGVDFEKYQKSPLIQDKTLVFMGNTSYLPNYYGLKWFVENVFPTILEKNPDSKLKILCNKYPDFLQSHAHKNIEVDIGEKDDVHYYAQSRIFICPLFSGGGIKIKVIQAMACAKAIITTDVGIQGLAVSDSENILVANTQQEWIEKILQYFTNDDALIELSENGFEFCKQNFNCEKNFSTLKL